MDNNIKLDNYSRTGSIVAGIGTLIMVLAFVIFLFVNRKKEAQITTITTELEKKDSINSALNDTLLSLNKPIEPAAYAIPTGRFSNPGPYHTEQKLPQFQYSLYIVVDDSLKNEITSVDYYLDHPSFTNKHLISRNSIDSFKVKYIGWGCLDTVNIYIQKKNNSFDTLNFSMCENLRLRGLSIAVN